ncbi:TetR/AcrR family transcriptional regulator [Streptomyces cinereospinus]|uniref:TetR/AcrR family transcriptional regulator n=1 Tax=Streptomyces cinereospinus TaxID=285561 RepID=A0ABV5NBJ6_9ACTN
MTTNASPKNKRVELGERSREMILDVATRLMSARGYEGTSISAIAKEAGLPASSIYWHFSSKVGILTAVMERGNAAFHAEVSKMESPAKGSHYDKVLAIFEQGITALERNPDFVRLQIILILNSPAGTVNEAVIRMRAQARDGMRSALEQAFEDLGRSQAEAVAASLVEFVSACFEGIFLARQAASPATHRLMQQLAHATVALADTIMSSDTNPRKANSGN